jgi:hypothetical protein
MFNSMNRVVTMKIAHRWMILSGLVLALLLASACGGVGPAPSGSNAPPHAATGARTGQVVITGAINKTYTPEEAMAVKISDHVGINLNEKSVCGVSIQFPIDMKPGAYPIRDHLHVRDHLHEPVVDIFGEYDAQFCDDTPVELKHTFLSTTGKLTLTATSGKFSGTFEFTAGNVQDKSKTIQVSGSFSDVALP